MLSSRFWFSIVTLVVVFFLFSCVSPKRPILKGDDFAKIVQQTGEVVELPPDVPPVLPGKQVLTAEPTAVRGNERNITKETNLHIWSTSGDVERIRSLLGSGIDVNTRNHEGKTSLHIAAEKGHTEVAELLIAHGADVNAQDRDKVTPLHRASEGGHIAISKLLVAHGADVNAKDRWGLMPRSLDQMLPNQKNNQQYQADMQKIYSKIYSNSDCAPSSFVKAETHPYKKCAYRFRESVSIGSPQQCCSCKTKEHWERLYVNPVYGLENECR